MVGFTVVAVKVLVILFINVSTVYSHNMGFFAMDLKRVNPLVIKRYSQNSPVFINIKSESAPMQGIMQKFSEKAPSRLAMIDPPSPKFARSILAPVYPKLPYVPYMLPLVPKLPYLPTFPWAEPKPTPGIVPLAPPVAKVDRITPWGSRASQILGQLMQLKQRGSLTTSEFIRMKNMLYKNNL